MRDTDVAFFDLFAGDAPGFEPAALAVIRAGLPRGVAPVAIHDAAQLLQAYELMYWAAGTNLWRANPGLDRLDRPDRRKLDMARVFGL